jgi:beta-1,2-mannobiose phosphorylase / 1,2-beta-oligomannan phosphorylase
MITIKKEGVLLAQGHFDFENEGVFNPAAMKDGDSEHLFYRAVQKGNHSTIEYCRLTVL